MKASYVCAILIAFCGCVSNDELEISSSGTEDFKDNSELVKAFDHLNKEIGSGDLSIDNQMKVFYNYAVSRKLEMNLNNSTCSRKGKEVSLPGVSKEHEKIIRDDLAILDSYVINNGPGLEALSLVNSYEKKLVQGIYKQLDKSELDVLLEHTKALKFLSGTSVGQEYFQNLSVFSNKHLSKETVQARVSASPAECTFYVAMVGYYTYACISTPWPLNVVPCGLLVYYAIQAAGCPGGGGGGSPCAGSTNPCCGISCITGYGCINGQCVQDGGYVPPSCPGEGCFWSGFECVCL